MAKANFIIYGSYGYTGRLIAEYACKEGLKPVLAGRNKEKVITQASKLGLEYRVFDIDNLEETKKAIKDFVAVVHCAGPFIKTYKNMVQACLEAQTHYMDITGEVDVIENLTHLNEQAKAANIMLLPGAGFDVVPSDCLAQYLKSRLPDATELILAVHVLKTDASGAGLSVSRGTAHTMVESLGEGSLIRDGGVLKRIPLGWKSREFDFGLHKMITGTTIAWGDLASAWWSTKIPHIETYMATPQRQIKILKLINPLRSVFKLPFIQKLLFNRINKLPEGPSEDQLQHTLSSVYGEVTNAAGQKAAARLQTPNGYVLTALTVVNIVKKVLAGNVPIGFQTPSTAYTQDLILEIPDVTRVDIS